MKTLFLVLISLFLLSCNNESKDAERAGKETYDDASSQDGTKSEIENIADTLKTGPLYKITVTQKGEALGEIKITTFPQIAPEHCRNFDSLVNIGFFNGLAFHRVIPGFMIQGGDPNSKNKPKSTWGEGDPKQRNIPAEFNDISHLRGIVSAARAQDINSANSQFFIMTGNHSRLDHQYTAYGKVLEGMEVVDKIANMPRDDKDNPIDRVVMKIERAAEAK